MEDYKKKYEDALERMKSWAKGEHPECFTDAQKTAEFIFPELKESKDEKIRKALISVLTSDFEKDTTIDGITVEEILAWLEKQGEKNPVPDWMPKFLDELRLKKNYFDWDEHRDIEGGILAIIKWMTPNYFNEKDGEPKPADEKEPTDYNSIDPCFGKPIDKREPKFNVGDWISHNTANFVFQVVSFGSCGYEVINRDNYTKTISFDNEGNYHLWTVQDAKDGDVLVCGEQLFLFKRMNTSNSFYSHCSYHFIGYDSLSVYDCSYSIDNIYPATEQQRGLLFQKMKEVGYEWDAKKLELKKIEQPKLTAFEEAVKGMMDEYMYAIGGNPDAITEEKVRNNSEYLLSLIPQNPTGWTEEDANMFGSIRSTLSMYMNNLSLPKEIRDIHEEELKWLDELYDRGLS